MAKIILQRAAKPENSSAPQLRGAAVELLLQLLSYS